MRLDEKTYGSSGYLKVSVRLPVMKIVVLEIKDNNIRHIFSLK